MIHFRPSNNRFFHGALFVLLGLSPLASVTADEAHKAYEARPIMLGVSGGSIEHISDKGRLYCHTGTLGALVTDGSAQYILSNNHVLAKENEPDDPDLAADGFQIIQPGLLDEGACTLSSGNAANRVGYLSEYVYIYAGKGKNLPTNHVDAAIAAVDCGDGSASCVSADGYIKDIGTVAGSGYAAVGMPVQKSGRTSGHTFGEVMATDVTIDVRYDVGTARFENQIRIEGLCGKLFSDGGDSGSVILNMPDATDTVSDNDDRLVVGLLFAGGGGSTFANHIDLVLADLGNSAVNQFGTSASYSMVQCTDGSCRTVTDSVPPDYCASTDSGDGSGGKKGRGRPFSAPSPLGLELAAAIKARHSAALFANPDVVGHGVGINRDGEPVIEVYVKGAARRAAGKPLPDLLEGVPVRPVATGEIIAY